MVLMSTLLPGQRTVTFVGVLVQVLRIFWSTWRSKVNTNQCQTAF